MGERLGGFIYGTIVALAVVVAGAKAYPHEAGHIAALVAQYAPRVLVLDLSRVPDVEYSALQMLVEKEARTKEQNDALEKQGPDPKAGPFGYPNARDAVEPGWGNKAISLKLSRNVIIRDVSILHVGHFAILATARP